MKLTEIQDLIKFVARSGVTEVEIEQANFKITIKSESDKKKKGSQQQQEAYLQQPMQMMPQMMPQQMQPVQQMQQQAPSAAEPTKDQKAEDESKYITVKSPMIGTFYRSPGPDKDPFLSVGDDIKEGKVICIIEAMKLFNEIEAEISGKIVKVLAEDASPVEYDQPLFLVDPS
ncbi:acetyl-CoA carboxylase biotin carboxyl carrier protein [Cryomorpha ignava]|uniref:Biotin carboxyl carrier protein of acetyl-CoA carboxylase n=1 Tax=Cryomorpha ignava TaxID=101383 RepID=A0A7K3WSP3_9FLAO|nr:acetyl-CoA carboxylase biotin carboxyl carrier protein [Cryomorpha ignava]NEN24548.1 acetyl-CoA carboxylase biotin carboxyl carrier protein [Cryomorpha ignava]